MSTYIVTRYDDLDYIGQVRNKTKKIYIGTTRYLIFNIFMFDAIPRTVHVNFLTSLYLQQTSSVTFVHASR